MSHIEKVKQQAIEVKILYDAYLETLSDNERLEFRAAFHLRPTSCGKTTIVSTLQCAPMRGLPNCTLTKIKEKLPELQNVVLESESKQLTILEKAKFKFKNKGFREENAQAAFIRNVIQNKFDDMIFVASEFDLFEFGEKKEIKRPDVFSYRNGVLYDIELKNERTTATVEQSARYVAHLKKNLSEYSDCLYEYPSFKITEIRDVKGIALVPDSEESIGTLELASKKLDVDLWFFNQLFNVRKT
ncbi:MAG: hypothetical protein FWE82_02290 [Defluviitaleaceae bacterium]|nr:hypothetical protein [Defluviitaleaceae bacterium]